MEQTETNPLHRRFAALIQRIAPQPSPELALAVELLSQWQSDGHVCLPLNEITPADLRESGLEAALPARKDWASALRRSGMVGAAGEFKPLILDRAQRLYLQRHWQYENAVAQEIARRANFSDEGNLAAIKKIALPLFASASDLQKLAAIVAATSRLTIISGAPGTGKTQTIVMICALLLALDGETEIALAAPTGKAAARLKQAFALARTRLNWPAQILQALPTEAATVQRLLGARTGSAHFRHDAGKPLTADVIIVDEASMIDLALLAKLLAAARPEARVILVGDKDQLASVEAGSAFRDICTSGFANGLSERAAEKFERVFGQKLTAEKSRAPVHDVVVELRENFRFAEGSGLAELSEAVNAGDAGRARTLLEKGDALTWRPTPNMHNFERALEGRVREQFLALRNETDPTTALARLSEFTVLCALRRGPFGAESVNRMIERMLLEAGDIQPGEANFPGRALMITRNDYDAGLFNGDIGIVLRGARGLRAFFPGDDGLPRSFAVARLPEHASAFALSVHKSQGSEFREALLILPDRDAPVLTRELLYTGATRVRERLEVWAPRQFLDSAIGRTVRRSSGLRDSLWGAAK